jgi:F-type H+-transporting ATPase subunit b
MRLESVAKGVMSVVALAALGSSALGAEAGAAQPGVMDFNLVQYGAAVLVFLVALGILSRTAWPKISKGLEDRENKIRNEINSAEEARKRADDALKQYERSLAEAKAEASRMIETTKAEQSRLAADLRVKAEAELTELREAALKSIDAAKRAALSEIYAEAADLATAVASKVLDREVNAADQARLIQESVSEFKGSYASV